MSTTETDFNTVKLIQQDHVGTVLLNRPEKSNALSPAVIHDIIAAFDAVKKNNDIRAVVLTGAGKSFSAGGDVEKDLNPLRSMGVSEYREYFAHAEDLYVGIINLEKPVIAAMNGFAVGAGLDLALVCDIRIAADDAQMGEFFVRMGICPEVAPFLLPKIVGLGQAKLMCMTGDLVDAEQAEKIGLVEQVVPASELISTAEALAHRLANGAGSVGVIKKAINQSLTMTLEGSLDYVAGLQFQMSKTEDHAEAVTAWLEKRKPVFTGK